VGQFEPGPGKSVGKGIRILVKTFGDGAVTGIHLKGHIGVCHHGIAAYTWFMGIEGFVFFLDVNRLPLPGAGRTFGQGPVIGK